MSELTCPLGCSPFLHMSNLWQLLMHQLDALAAPTAMTVNIDICSDVVSAAVPMSVALQRPMCESPCASESAATTMPESAAVRKAAAAKRGRKGTNKKGFFVPLQVQTWGQTAAHERHLQRMRRVGDTILEVTFCSCIDVANDLSFMHNSYSCNRSAGAKGSHCLCRCGYSGQSQGHRSAQQAGAHVCAARLSHSAPSKP